MSAKDMPRQLEAAVAANKTFYSTRKNAKSMALLGRGVSIHLPEPPHRERAIPRDRYCRQPFPRQSVDHSILTSARVELGCNP